jgi:CubicO group peptidase (beta-lactamase class C family)
MDDGRRGILGQAVDGAIAEGWRPHGRARLVVAVQDPWGQIERGIGTDSDTVFEIASITKVFTALVLAQMVLRGDLGLETRVEEILPAGALDDVSDPRVRGITLEQLALHTSGLPKNSRGLWRSAALSPLAPFSHLRRVDVDRTLARCRLQAEQGAAWSYSNVGYGLLGILLSEVTGKPFGELVDELVSRPLELRATSVEPRAAAAASMYGARVPPWSNGACAAAGDLRSTAADLLLVGALAHGGGPNALRDAAALTLSRRVERGPGEWQALGWQGWRIDGSDWVGHGGAATGSRASLTVHPPTQTVVVALAAGGPRTIRSLDRLVPTVWWNLAAAE